MHIAWFTNLRIAVPGSENSSFFKSYTGQLLAQQSLRCFDMISWSPKSYSTTTYITSGTVRIQDSHIDYTCGTPEGVYDGTCLLKATVRLYNKLKLVLKVHAGLARSCYITQRNRSNLNTILQKL